MKDSVFQIPEASSAVEEIEYIRKLLAWRLLQVFTSAITASLFVLVPAFYDFFESKWYVAIAFKVALVPLTLALFKVERIGASLILSLFFGVLFTICFGCMFGSLLSGLGATFLISVVSFYAGMNVMMWLNSWHQNEEYTMKSGFIAAGEMTVYNLVLCFLIPGYPIYLIWVPLIMCLYGFFVAFHSKMISQGKFRVLPRERIVLGVLSIYIDFFMLKFYIIGLCCKKKNEDGEEVEPLKKV